MVSSTYHQIQSDFPNWNVLSQCFLKSKYIKSRTFNDKNRWIIKKVMGLKKLLPHLATRGTYSPGDWRCDEVWREQTLANPPVMCQRRLSYCTWALNVMIVIFSQGCIAPPSFVLAFVSTREMISSWINLVNVRSGDSFMQGSDIWKAHLCYY